MDHRQSVRFISAGRIAIGAVMLVAPRRGAASWVGPDGRSGALTLLVRSFGAREVALGAGTLASLDSGGPARPWVMAGVVADGLDAVASVLAIRHLGRRTSLGNRHGGGACHRGWHRRPRPGRLIPAHVAGSDQPA